MRDEIGATSVRIAEILMEAGADATRVRENGATMLYDLLEWVRLF